MAFSYRESRRGALEEAEAVRRLGRRAFTGPADARVPGEMAAFVDEAAAVLGGTTSWSTTWASSGGSPRRAERGGTRRGLRRERQGRGDGLARRRAAHAAPGRRRDRQRREPRRAAAVARPPARTARRRPRWSWRPSAWRWRSRPRSASTRSRPGSSTRPGPRRPCGPDPAGRFGTPRRGGRCVLFLLAGAATRRGGRPLDGGRALA